ncbi:MAG: HAD family hydrolase [Candidatus Aenigmarchaeota archaeon]|nr:HAD family hydrolase [Candidatus Aenigmarchaeota archaeon]
MPYSHVFWDMDGVMIPGRGTTHLANNYEADPEAFMNRFIRECGKEGSLRDVRSEDLERGLREWEAQYNGGRGIATIGELGACLTDLRHKLKVFPSARESTYTKNAILRGMTIGDIMDVAERSLPYNPGVEEAVKTFREYGAHQYLFTNANEALAACVARRLGFEYCEGAKPKIILPDWTETPFDPEKHLEVEEACLLGEMEEYEKLDRVIGFIEKRSINPSEAVAIDDTEVDMLVALRERGSLVLGFYNPTDPVTSTKHRDKMKELGIRVLEDDLQKFAELVLKPENRQS